MDGQVWLLCFSLQLCVVTQLLWATTLVVVAVFVVGTSTTHRIGFHQSGQSVKWGGIPFAIGFPNIYEPIGKEYRGAASSQTTSLLISTLIPAFLLPFFGKDASPVHAIRQWNRCFGHRVRNPGNVFIGISRLSFLFQKISLAFDNNSL